MRLNYFVRFIAVAAVLLLASCGGGGGSSSSTPASNTVQAAPTISISLTPASITSAQTSTLAWSTTNATTCTASGDWSGAKATSGGQSVSQITLGTFVYVFGLDCSGPGGSASSSATLTITPVVSNSVPIVLDGGSAGASPPAFNTPFVSVTICVPGTATCQTIDHVILDTGSTGLRLIQPGVVSLSLPQVLSSSNNALAECAVFADGFTWGAVRSADIKLAGEVALNTPIETIGENPGGVAVIPADCSGTGPNKSSAASLGAKGILGVGLFANDCDACKLSVIAATYYSCPVSGCVGTMVTSSQVIPNPVALFPQDNNGVVVALPAVGNTGAKSPSGSLIFGIGTQANNVLGSATVYATNTSTGRFFTTYKGIRKASFIDSGSNGIFFADATIAQCTLSIGFYCPASPLALTATNAAASGVASSVVNFSVVSVDGLGTGVTVGNAGGTLSNLSSQFDWGIPFFFGRKVFTAIKGAATTAGQGPYWAY